VPEKPNPRGLTPEERVCAAGSRQGYWMDTCPVHGLTSFNTIIDGCEQCAAKRLAEEDKKDANA